MKISTFAQLVEAALKEEVKLTFSSRSAAIAFRNKFYQTRKRHKRAKNGQLYQDAEKLSLKLTGQTLIITKASFVPENVNAELSCV